MAVPIVSATVEGAYNNAFVNVNSLAESSVDLQLRLATWRATYFDLLDASSEGGQLARQWVVPTLFLENSMVKGVPIEPRLRWVHFDDIISTLQRTLYAVLYDGYTPSAGTQTAIVAAFNAAWT